MKYFDQSDFEIEKAIKFLVEKISLGSKNPKPLIMHSLRVAFYLDGLGYSSQMVIAAVLHDLLEDTDTIEDEIRQLFGSEVLKLVVSNTIDSKIKDRFERDKELFDRCLHAGKDALLIKSADILDNSNFFHMADHEEWLYMLGKMKYFNNLSNEMIRNEKPWKDVNEKYEKLKSTFI